MTGYTSTAASASRWKRGIHENGMVLRRCCFCPQHGLCTGRFGGRSGVVWRRGGAAPTATRGTDWRPIGTHFDSATFGGVGRSGGLRPATPFWRKAHIMLLVGIPVRSGGSAKSWDRPALVDEVWPARGVVEEAGEVGHVSESKRRAAPRRKNGRSKALVSPSPDAYVRASSRVGSSARAGA